MPADAPRPVWTGRVSEWKADKGYGWLLWEKKRVFLHRRDLGDLRGELVVGETIRFTLGQDAQSRPCATNAVAVSGGHGGIGLLSLLVLSALLVLPGIALQKSGVEVWKAVAAVVAVSLVTYSVYASDKSRARRRQWRVPESQLHLLEFLGGWPGAWLAQRSLRHKCSKASYQVTFWGIILMHEFAAWDFINHGPVGEAIIQWLKLTLRG